MRNHDEKIKDMGRSVLPSTGRRNARATRRMNHHRQRAVERAALAAYRGAADPEVVTPDFRGTIAQDTWELVWVRRSRDKVAPLVRWAQATIAADPELRAASLEEQVGHFARLMPDTVIGRHAVNHIRQALEWRDRRELYAARTRGRAGGRDPRVAETERLARQILESGLHAELNSRLRRACDLQAMGGVREVLPPRLLLGEHDVPAFAAALVTRPAARAAVVAVAALAR